MEIKAQRIRARVSAPQKQFLLSRRPVRLFVGGVGAGKTTAGCLAVCALPAGARVLVIAPTYRMLADVIWYSVMRLFEKSPVPPNGNRTDMVITLPNGTELILRSATHPERLRGLEVDALWIDEAAYISEEVFHVALGRARRARPLVLLTTTPAGFNWLYRRFVENPPSDVEIVRAPTYSNPGLPPEYLESLRASYTELLYQQEVLAQFVDVGGAVFRSSWIQYGDLPTDLFTPAVRRYLGVDLAISQKSSADYTAIVGVAEYMGRWYVFEAEQGRWTFAEQLHQIRRAAEKYRATTFVEAQGYQQAMVQELLRRTDATIMGVSVHRDKLSRFQPIAARYENGLIVHCRRFPALEGQLIAMGGEQEHDDLVDALVLAISGSVREGERLLRPGKIKVEGVLS